MPGCSQLDKVAPVAKITKSTQQKRQERLVVIGAVGVVALSVVTTLLFSDVLLNKLAGNGDGGYKNTTFTDAVISCRAHSQKAYGRQLEQLTLDDHSSRMDDAANQFKIFFKAMMVKRSDDSGEFYINCYVSAESGRITYYEGMEQKSSPTEAIRRNDGGLFGWPILGK